MLYFDQKQKFNSIIIDEFYSIDANVDIFNQIPKYVPYIEMIN